MLGKLLKYNFRSVNKLLILLNACALILALLAGLVSGNLGVLFSDSSSTSEALETSLPSTGNLFSLIVVVTVFLAIMGIYFASFLIVSVRFYRNMFTDEGYLTHTLPVKSGTHLLGHIITMTTWNMIALVILLFNVVMITTMGVSIGQGLSIFQPVTTFLDYVSSAYHTHPALIALGVLLYFLVASFSATMIVCVSISIGSLFPGHKLMASVIAFLCVYMVLQVSNTLVMLCNPGFRNLLFTSANSELPPAEFFQIFPVTSIFLILFGIAGWIASHIIVSKHLNLE